MNPLHTRRLAAVAAIAVATVTLAACSDAAPSNPPSSPSITSAPPVQAGQYELVDDVCEHVDLDAILAVLPEMTVDPVKTESPVTNVMLCSGEMGLTEDANDQGIFSFYVEVFPDSGEAEDYYNQFYDTNKSLSGATEVPGLGQHAYQMFVPVLNTPTVKVLDGNAVLSCEWYPLAEDDVPAPDGIYEALIETIRGAIASLQAA